VKVVLEGIRRLIQFAIITLLSGCSSVDHGLPNRIRGDIVRAREIEAEVGNNLQILLCVGLIRDDDLELANTALHRCLDIVGWPDRMEEEYARELETSDIKEIEVITGKLLEEKSSTVKRLGANHEKLTNAYHRYSASHASLSALKFVIGGLITVLGLVVVVWIFIRRI
jgi:hypothetical protein